MQTPLAHGAPQPRQSATCNALLVYIQLLLIITEITGQEVCIIPSKQEFATLWNYKYYMRYRGK